MATTTSSRATSLLAVLAAVALVLSACSDDSGDGASTETTAPADGATTTTAAGAEPVTETPAANLRADLTALLEEQVYLTGFAIEEGAAAANGRQAGTVQGYEAAAEESAAELGDLIGATYGVAAGTDFLSAWNAHRDAILDVGFGEGPPAAVESTRDDVVALLEEIDGEADFAGVAGALAAADDAMLTVVEELSAGIEGAAIDLRGVASEMPVLALELATIMAEHGGMEGDVGAEEVALRADLTGLLQESALLTGLALAETVQAGGDASAPGPADVFAAVEENATALAELLIPADAAAAEELTQLWNDHVVTFEDYTVATFEGDAPGIQAAEDALLAFRDDVGAVLSELYPAMSPHAVAEELVPHTESMLAYVNAVVEEERPAAATEADEPGAGDEATDSNLSSAPGLLREAALAMRLAARTFAGAMAAPVATS